MAEDSKPAEEAKAETAKATKTKTPKEDKKPAAKATKAEAKEETPKKAAAKKAAPKKEEAPAEVKTEDAPKAEKKEAAKPKRARIAAKRVEVEATEGEDAPEEEAPETVAEATEIEVEETRPTFQERPIVLPKDVKPIEDFDWSSLGEQKNEFDEGERSKMEAAYGDTLTSINNHEVLNGKVTTVNKKEVVVNIGYKSDGVIAAAEFRYNEELKEGDMVEVYVENREDANGQLILSHRKARMLQAWERINNAKDTGEIVTGFVKCRTKGGLIADVFGMEAFLPGSQIDVKPIKDYDQFVGKNMQFKVVKINPEFRNVVVSHKALIEEEIEEQKVEIMKNLEKGQVLEGIVKNITSYGVFVDLGGVDGLIHITDLSWGRVAHPEDVVEVEQTLNVVILDFDDEKKRIALGVKQLQEHPWESLGEDLQEGSKVNGKVVVLADYGAFVEVAEGVEGLIHVSEMSWSQHLRTAHDFFKVGDEIEATVMSIDREERKLSLSTRRLSEDPWENIEKKYPTDSRHKGKVTNLSNFGVFVELEEGIDGLVHISDLSWYKKINHPAEVVKVGEEIETMVLEIDKENRRLSLGLKQLEENPWDAFEGIFEVGSIHEGTITKMADKGAVVELSYGMEGFAPGKHLVKEDGSKAKQDEKLEFKIIEYNRDAKKIIVSHSRIHEDVNRASKSKDKKEAIQQRSNARKAVKDMNDKRERTTLGDLSVLSALKKDLENEEKKS